MGKTVHRQAAGVEGTSADSFPSSVPGKLHLQTVLRLLFGASMALVLVVALRPAAHGDRLRGLPKPVARFLNEHDDLSNFVAFFVLSGLGFQLRGSVRPAEEPPAPWFRRHGVRLGLFLLLVVAIECGQRWIPGRVSDWSDVATGWGGIFAAWVLDGFLAARLARPPPK